MTKAADKINDGLKDALAFSQGDASRGRVHAPDEMVAGQDGWTDWVHPLPGYVMECCGCGMRHQMQFAITPPKPNTDPGNLGESTDRVVVFRARSVIADRSPSGPRSQGSVHESGGAEGNRTTSGHLLHKRSD